MTRPPDPLAGEPSAPLATRVRKMSGSRTAAPPDSDRWARLIRRALRPPVDRPEPSAWRSLFGDPLDGAPTTTPDPHPTAAVVVVLAVAFVLGALPPPALTMTGKLLNAGPAAMLDTLTEPRSPTDGRGHGDPGRLGAMIPAHHGPLASRWRALGPRADRTDARPPGTPYGPRRGLSGAPPPPRGAACSSHH